MSRLQGLDIRGNPPSLHHGESRKQLVGVSMSKKIVRVYLAGRANYEFKYDGWTFEVHSGSAPGSLGPEVQVEPKSWTPKIGRLPGAENSRSIFSKRDRIGRTNDISQPKRIGTRYLQRRPDEGKHNKRIR